MAWDDHTRFPHPTWNNPTANPGDGLAVTTGDAKGALDLDHRVVWRRGGAGPKTHLPHQTEY